MNQLQVTIISVEQLIQETDDDEIKQLLREIREAIKAKNVGKVKTTLRNLMDKSWETFLKALPWILEQWSKNG